MREPKDFTFLGNCERCGRAFQKDDEGRTPVGLVAIDNTPGFNDRRLWRVSFVGFGPGQAHFVWCADCIKETSEPAS